VKQGHPVAQTNLGVMHQFGEGVEQGYKEAAEWYQKAAQQGDAQAMFNLSALYR